MQDLLVAFWNTWYSDAHSLAAIQSSSNSSSIFSIQACAADLRMTVSLMSISRDESISG
jgi:hypothetical protein